MNHDQSPAAAVDNNNNKKKKKRRSNRKSKQISPVSASTSVNETCLKSLRPLNTGTLDEQNLTKASDVAFTSLPTMHLDDQQVLQEGGIIQNQQILRSDYDGRMLLRSCPEPTACEKSAVYSNVRNDFHSSRRTDCKAQRRYFATYWSNEAITGGLEGGDVFKALIRTNAHNRLEAYCKIDGVTTDILISGIGAHNRAVFFSKARVVGLGSRFMSIYIQKLAIERRIYYDEVEGLTAEWLDATCTLILSLSTTKHIQRSGSPAKCRPLEEAVLFVSPHNLMVARDPSGKHCNEVGSSEIEEGDALASVVHIQDVEPAVFPLTVRISSTISVALHAVGGNGPHDIGARLYVSSYFV